MAEVRLADVIEPSIFLPYSINRTLTTNAFVNAGVIVNSPELNAFAAASRGSIVDVPFFSPLGNPDPNIGSDNPASSSTPNKIGTGKQVGVKHIHNQSWSSMDLASALIGEDPLAVIAGQVGDYWSEVLSKVVINTCVGIAAADVAGPADMTIAGGTDALDADAIIDAKGTVGDRLGSFSAIAMHSITYTALQKAELITFIRNSENNTEFASYNGMRVVVDDALPSASGSNGFLSVLFGAGAFGLGFGAPRVPVEVDRAPAAGDGEGQETLYSRRHYIAHPGGYQMASGAGQSPTMAELQAAGTYTRAFERKRIPLAFVTHQQVA